MARELYCWRCDKVLPMLDDDEWARMGPVLSQAWSRIKRHCRQHRVGPHEAMQVAGRDAFDFYERLTGYRETSFEAIWHHQASRYGPPCALCGKPLRTPQAKLCAACGHPRALAPG